MTDTTPDIKDARLLQYHQQVLSVLLDNTNLPKDVCNIISCYCLPSKETEFVYNKSRSLGLSWLHIRSVLVSNILADPEHQERNRGLIVIKCTGLTCTYCWRDRTHGIVWTLPVAWSTLECDWVFVEKGGRIESWPKIICGEHKDNDHHHNKNAEKQIFLQKNKPNMDRLQHMSLSRFSQELCLDSNAWFRWLQPMCCQCEDKEWFLGVDFVNMLLQCQFGAAAAVQNYDSDDYCYDQLTFSFLPPHERHDLQHAIQKQSELVSRFCTKFNALSYLDRIHYNASNGTFTFSDRIWLRRRNYHNCMDLLLVLCNVTYRSKLACFAGLDGVIRDIEKRLRLMQWEAAMKELRLTDDLDVFVETSEDCSVCYRADVLTMRILNTDMCKRCIRRRFPQCQYSPSRYLQSHLGLS